MSPSISQEYARNLVQKYWPFSPYLLKEEVLQTARLSPLLPHRIKHFLQAPPPQRLPHCALVLFTIHSTHLPDGQYFQPALLLPFHWEKGKPHSPHLPPNLKHTADQILQQFSPSTQWGLSFASETPPPWNTLLHHLNCHHLNSESAWASLAAALILKQHQTSPNPRILATGAWDNGLQKISSLQPKIQTAIHWGAEKLFLPPQNFEEALQILQKLPPSQLQLEKLRYNDNPRIALGPYLASLELPPPPHANLNERCQYYQRLSSFDAQTARHYYIEYLQQDLAKECAKRGIQNLSEQKQKQLKNLITFASFNPESAMFVISTLRPKHLLLFYTPQSQKNGNYQKILHYCQKLSPTPTITGALYPEPNSPQATQKLLQKVQSFLQQYGAKQTAWDITPGPKDFNLLMSWILPRHVTFLYLSHHWDHQTRKFAPGQELIRRIHPPPPPQTE